MNYPQQAHHVTLVITHSIQPEKQADYEKWLETIMPQAASFPGHLGVNVLRPVHGDNAYTVLIRFVGMDELYAWLKSPARQELVRELPAILAQPEHIEVRPGAAFWFTPTQKGQVKPAKWKQYLLTLGVIFPSANLVPWFWNTVLPVSHGTLWGNFLDNASVVALVVFLWMPLLTRVLKQWLIGRNA
ncbi:antibiotic biosynthesis monooxygenase [Pantoea sp. At-9b]|jgi:uncharacterized protein|uniref:antibiotic biosynthesis monooxygenase n=1 Tax=Pantoea sp. (strain At-9b) TaxID=592316 RepID=UPI0001B3DF00|nr:antibiotic biosynthesis monooxygenase [Pantoea sp. At-9b]ADU70581.1 Antibiotic biosynthesis monooxygenase [Pantoea sp. At-9b]